MPSLFKTPTLQKLKPYYLLFVLLLATHACKKNSEEKPSSACKLPLIRTVHSSNIFTNLLFLILLGLAPRELSSAYFTGGILPSPSWGR